MSAVKVTQIKKGRSGFQLLNFGIGAFWGPEQDGITRNKRWVIDVDAVWQPTRRFLLAGEFVYGGEDNVSTREVGRPVARAASVEEGNWLGVYVLGYYELAKWLGLTARYGYFNDMDASRTGVEAYTALKAVNIQTAASR